MLCIVSHEIHRKVKFKHCLYCPDQCLTRSQNCVFYLPLCSICLLPDRILAAFSVYFVTFHCRVQIAISDVTDSSAQENTTRVSVLSMVHL